MKLWVDDDEKEIIRLRYFSDKSQSETALITGYSQAKVSRIESKSLHKLRDYYSWVCLDIYLSIFLYIFVNKCKC